MDGWMDEWMVATQPPSPANPSSSPQLFKWNYEDNHLNDDNDADDDDNDDRHDDEDENNNHDAYNGIPKTTVCSGASKLDPEPRFAFCAPIRPLLQSDCSSG